MPPSAAALRSLACGPFAILALALPLGLLACGAEETGAGIGPTARDSAGIRIVESEAPTWSAGEAWRLADEPELDIGGIDAPEEEQLYRVADAATLSDGSVVVADLGHHELRRFAPDGAHVWTTGGEGDGPGEFRGLIAVASPPGDTLVTYDFRQRRFSRFLPDGTFLDAVPLEGGPERSFPFVDAWLPGGRAVVTWQEFPDGLPAEGEVRRNPARVTVEEPGGGRVEIGRFPGQELAVLSSSTGGGAMTISTGETPFSRGLEVAAGPAGVYVADTERWEVLRFTPAGELEAILRRKVEPVAVTDELRRRAIDEELEEAADDDERRLVRRRWEGLPVPATLPALASLAVDAGGNLWVRRYPRPGEETRIWSVFDPAGGWLGDVELPDRFTPLEIGKESVLGRFGDELDLSHVQRWRLVKPDAT